MNIEYANVITAIASVFVAVVTLIVTIVMGIRQSKQNKRIDERDEHRRTDLIYADATKFILKYSSASCESEIYLLPLCIMAYMYNPLYPYRREMYREFCSLTEEVQNCILTRCNIDVQSAKTDKFYDCMLDCLKSDIKSSYPDDNDLYYEGGKYFERALLNHGNKDVPNIKFSANDNGIFTTDYKSHITDLLAYEKDSQPIKRLMYESTSMGMPVEADEILISYLSCVVAEYVPDYSHGEEEGKYENIGYVDDFQGKLYMEDLFLKALYSIYVHQ